MTTGTSGYSQNKAKRRNLSSQDFAKYFKAILVSLSTNSSTRFTPIVIQRTAQLQADDETNIVMKCFVKSCTRKF